MIENRGESTRRTFLFRCLRISLGIGATVAVFQPCPADSLKTENLSDSEALTEIKRKWLKFEIAKIFGVEIPSSEDKRFLIENDFFWKNFDSPSRMPTLLSVPELKAFKEVLARIPYAGHLAHFLIPYRFHPSESPVLQKTKGIYLGREWEQYVKDYNLETLDKDKAIAIFLADDIDLDKPIEPHMEAIGIERYISSTESKVSLKTYKDKLQWGIIHEYGHAFDNEVFFRARGLERYQIEKHDRISLFDNISAFNPVYQTFAKVNGWKLIPFEEALNTPAEHFTYSRRNNIWPYSSPGVWKRDPEVWEKPETQREIRLTIYAQVRPIDEVFAEYFAASILQPNLLTPQEKRYFDKIHSELMRNPEEFMSQVASNPEILLN